MNTAQNELKIARDFSGTPGPRFSDEGNFSGEELRREHLLPRVREAIETRNPLTVDLDGTHGYLTSFLEEAFGGLIREDHLSYADIQKYLTIVSHEEPYLKDDIEEYLREAERES